jgi:hypothetical protein
LRLNLLALTAAVALASPAIAGDADFTLVNATGYPIAELYVAPSNSDSWGSDILGKHVINNKESWKITFAPSNNVCKYDMQIVFEDDNSKVTWKNFDLCEINKITLSYNRSTGVTTATKE